MPLLNVVTRTYKRPVMLAANCAALRRQSSPDWIQTMLIDTYGMGIAATYERLATYEPSGEWVWILDDDDLCIHDDLVKDLQELDRWIDFDVVMLKMDRDGAILPDKFTWQKPPQLAHVCVSCFIVKRAVWMAHRNAFSPGEYSSDFNFISAVFASDADVWWHDVVASKTQRIGHGEPESA